MASPTDRPHTRSFTFTTSLEKVVAELVTGLGRRGADALKRGAVMGTLSIASVSTAFGLAHDIMGPGHANAALTDERDWAQREGQRDEWKVHYYGEFWSHVETVDQTCGSRGCYGGTTTTQVFVKVRVQPQPGADIDAKRVGVVYRQQYDPTPRTAVGYYFSTHPDGYEEWHVPVRLDGYANFVVFDAWYQDGAGGPTWYDDNQGELHVAQLTNYHQMVRQVYYETAVNIEENGIYGTISIDVLDIDYDKDIRLVYTTDGWQTVHELGIGPGGLNQWVWQYNNYGNHQIWHLDLDIPGRFDSFEYAIVYRHGAGADGADTYEYWDNNYGQNYRVEAPTAPVP